MDIPKNCFECKYTHNCKAWKYGEINCKYQKELYLETMKKMGIIKE